MYSLHPGAERDIADGIDIYAQQAGMAVAESSSFDTSIANQTMAVAGVELQPM